jgi:hypothetical protein
MNQNKTKFSSVSAHIFSLNLAVERLETSYSTLNRSCWCSFSLGLRWKRYLPKWPKPKGKGNGSTVLAISKKDHHTFLSLSFICPKSWGVQDSWKRFWNNLHRGKICLIYNPVSNIYHISLRVETRQKCSLPHKVVSIRHRNKSAEEFCKVKVLKYWEIMEWDYDLKSWRWSDTSDF